MCVGEEIDRCRERVGGGDSEPRITCVCLPLCVRIRLWMSVRQ